MYSILSSVLEPIYKVFCVIITALIIVFLSIQPICTRIKSMKAKYYRHCIELFVRHDKKDKLYRFIQRIVKQKKYNILSLYSPTEFPYTDDTIFSVSKFIIFSIMGTELSDAQMRKALINSKELYFALSDRQVDIISEHIFTEDDKEERYELDRIRRRD